MIELKFSAAAVWFVMIIFLDKLPDIKALFPRYWIIPHFRSFVLLQNRSPLTTEGIAQNLITFIERVQQNRITPNATDFRMALEIGVLLANHEAEIYFIASGDCHFSVACQSIIRSGAKVYVIHNGKLCDELQTFSNKSFSIGKILEKLSPTLHVPLHALIDAFEKTPPEPNGNVTLSQLGQSWSKIKEMYRNQFAEKNLSTWQKDYPDQFEVVDQEVRLR